MSDQEFFNEGNLGYLNLKCNNFDSCKLKNKREDKKEIADIIEKTLIENNVLYPHTICQIYPKNIEAKKEVSADWKFCRLYGNFDIKIGNEDSITSGEFSLKGDLSKDDECEVLWSRLSTDKNLVDILDKKCFQ